MGFLNYYEGGEIYIGIVDDGTVVGVEDSDDIQKQGGLPQELSQEEFFEGISAPRNKELMRVFKDVRLAEQLGSGVQRILNVYDRRIFKFSPNFLKVSFPIKNDGENIFKLNNTQQKIISLIEQKMKTVPDTNLYENGA